MIIISHRGYWQEIAEKNSEIAFRRSFNLGFGTETDVRDAVGTLVISHDMPSGSEMTLDEFLALPGARDQLLALNIKADGLAACIQETARRHQLKKWFVFDMSIPDMRAHLQAGNPVFARMSEVEHNLAWHDEASGIWLDSFASEWYDGAFISSLLAQQKQVCVVSPELHDRDPIPLWQELRGLASNDNLILCTDHPERARNYMESTQ